MISAAQAIGFRSVNRNGTFGKRYIVEYKTFDELEEFQFRLVGVFFTDEAALIESEITQKIVFPSPKIRKVTAFRMNIGKTDIPDRFHFRPRIGRDPGLDGEAENAVHRNI